jgi:hypothetical protein
MHKTAVILVNFNTNNDTIEFTNSTEKPSNAFIIIADNNSTEEILYPHSVYSDIEIIK